MDLTIEKIKPFSAEVPIPGDKSISHRSVIIGAIASGNTSIHNFLPGEDCLSTLHCMRELGIEIEQISPTELIVHGKGLTGLSEPKDYLDVGNSGTTMRLLAGLLAGQKFLSILTGDESIRRRPMARVVEPLQKMGAKIWGRKDNQLAPLAIKGRPLIGIQYNSPVASAQIKSALLLAGLFAEGETSVTEPSLSRNHTEKMLQSFGARIKCEGQTTYIQAGELLGQEVIIPSDISSAAFFMALAAIIPEAQIKMKNIGLNPTRTGILDVLGEMGAHIVIENQQENSGELRGDITISGAPLKGTVIGGDLIPRLIDEIPVLAVVAAVAEGETLIKDAAELKVKESNRLQAIAVELRRFGVNIQETADGLIIKGGKNNKGALCQSYGDHRIAMACTLMGLVSSDKTTVLNVECIDISLPGFIDLLQLLIKNNS
jgi:3-phosphoshikimate 1-carboxyvinyltransferase